MPRTCAQVTILFADIKGFTSMSQQLHPSEVMLFLNHLYSLFDMLLEVSLMTTDED